MSVNRHAERQDISVLISGGGPVGLMLALGLAQQEKPSLLLEKNHPEQGESGSFDGRVLALTYASQQWLVSVGVWPDLLPYVTPIAHVHVSQKGFLGITQLHAEEVGVEALGYSITAADLGRVLWQKVRQSPWISVHTGASLTQLKASPDNIQVRFEDAQQTYEREVSLVVGADGTGSRVRTLTGLPLQTKQYDAYGVIARIETEQSPNGWAYERFTQTGPVALLPMQGHFSKAVWVVPSDEIDAVKALDDAAFMQGFAGRMGERFGRYVSVSERMAYPLVETYVEPLYHDRVVLMGNAAHTQHPVAAQGLNLGIQDIEAFLAEAVSVEDLGDAQWLENYAKARSQAHEKVMGLTDGLIQVFQSPSAVVGHLRGLGLMAMQAMPSVRKRFTKMAMGRA